MNISISYLMQYRNFILPLDSSIKFHVKNKKSFTFYLFTTIVFNDTTYHFILTTLVILENIRNSCLQTISNKSSYL